MSDTEYYRVIESFPEQIKKAIEIIGKRSITKKVNKIIITGMGGSAIPGDVLAAFLKKVPVPVFTNRSYHLPAFADKNTLVFAISYSGNTEETISAYREAVRKSCVIIAITSGGKLETLSNINNTELIKIPSGFQPRAALGYLFTSTAKILENTGIAPRTDWDHVIRTLKKPVFREMGESLAETIHKKIPIIYSSNHLFAAALRWKTQFNENSKIHAFANCFSELNHNEIVGFTKLNGKYHIIILKDNNDDERMLKRIRLTKKIIEDCGVDVTEIALKGSSHITKLLSAIYIGDWCSYYLALKNKVDPVPVSVIEDFKKKLGK
ncbi:bifunctional phosphoglucose/phosphomannose isomerase [Candidatus Woesearchaeota archaeon]|nr:MAG: bifunctional phosphoglucose/phosphomannose isomerase [Candidatus Woesearchaeota archaeon]